MKRSKPGTGSLFSGRHIAAFTLVELLVVILILAALILIALPRYFYAIYSAQVRGCQAQITVVNTACEAFQARNKVYPQTIEEMCISTAPGWVISPPLEDVPRCPFGIPYRLVPILQDGTVGGSATTGNPQVGITVNIWDHFEGSWKTATEHIR
jgi:competence protein ComGC